jgi:hypothetical protein
VPDPAVRKGRFRAARSRVLFALTVCVLLFVRGAAAEEAPVPLGLQVELLAKVAAYDKNLSKRAGDRVKILIVEKKGNADSNRAVAQIQTALSDTAAIAGLPHQEVVVRYAGATALAAAVRSERAAIVFLTVGFVDDIEAIRAALDGLDVLSVAVMPGYVPRGIVLGFDLVSGKPKLLVHLSQAKRQNVAFSADVLKLMRVFE